MRTISQICLLVLMASCAFCNGVAAEDVPTIGPSKDTPAKEVNALDLGVPQLIFSGNLVQDICAANTLGGEKEFSSIITREGSKLKTTIAHELGHQLGLNHVDTDVEGCPSGNLMCPIENMVNPTTKLETAQCTQARKAAKSFQAAKWH
jgi:Metallo-peptidase family M12B Reprolysin-like